jgi:FtsP/CotA-like multicopper oxidase with cupredoxin domain
MELAGFGRGGGRPSRGILLKKRSAVLMLVAFLSAAVLMAGIGVGVGAPWGAARPARTALTGRSGPSAAMRSPVSVPLAMRHVTSAMRQAAAARLAKLRRDDPAGFRAARAKRVSAAGTDYSGAVANYANSPIIRKFVDSLPGLGRGDQINANRNNRGIYIPVATPDTITYPGSDYYVIAVRQFYQKLHTDLPSTRLRGYVQLNQGTDASGSNRLAPASIHYLGPIIVARKNRPVRVLFLNQLPTGVAGNLFLPVDPTVMGAGMGPTDMPGMPGMKASYTQNRAVLHLHGGATPWISDGTPHQWITPAGEDTPYPKGVSVFNVPDMPDPGPGAETFFYTNQQSARLMFYHDHSYGITRLNVYAGEASGYLLTDPVEQELISGNLGVAPAARKMPIGIRPQTIPQAQIPLIIQDKTFVPAPAQLAAEDPTWDTVSWGGKGSLWFPHVYMPNQDPANPEGANPMGRWDYGPWFWPPAIPMHGPVALGVPGTPNPSLVPESFMDTPLVNGTPYPYLKVGRKAYRFRILNACNDRSLNLQIYFAKSNKFAKATKKGAPLLQTASGEVRMVPAVPHPGSRAWPTSWPTDGRDGGVPDPAARGPKMIQIGTEGGFLPAPVVLANTPVGYNYNRRDIVVLNVSNKTLFLGPAERADVIVDFSKVPAGSKLIMYNDSPAPVPAFDPRYDYYTGDPDQRSTGGAARTKAGYGPNTRTIMQFQVVGKTAARPFNLNALRAALPVAFRVSQDPIIVPEKAYGAPVNTYSLIQSESLTFTPNGTTTPINLVMQHKAIQELFEADYGRMNALLGVELPFTNILNQTTLPFGFIDPPTENVTDSVSAGPVTLGDGTQIWKITHNGVDTHAIHFHLFNVQLINRVGWDGMIRPPDANELGWKETVRMNPLEDAIVALRPIAPTLPWKIPESVRPLDPTSALDTTSQFSTFDPLGNPIVVKNEMTNFGWEYVWHCHLLGHEENDMMRPIVFHVAPAAPTTLTATVNLGPTRIDLAWIDHATVPAATSLTIQRATDSSFTAGLTTFAAPPADTAYSDSTVAGSTTYYYRIRAEDALSYSPWSNTASGTTP